MYRVAPLRGTGEKKTMQQEAIGENVLVYAYQFFPVTTFSVVTEIDDAEDILNPAAEDQLSAVANPDEFDGFVIRYTFSDVPYFAILYTPQDANVNEGDELSLSQNANYISADQNLLQTRLAEPQS